VWVFTRDSFLSIVDPSPRTGAGSSELLVRARFNGDIEAFHGEPLKVIETPNADYRYRALVKTGALVENVRRAIAEIDYPNFKMSIAESWRAQPYAKVWFVMSQAQRLRQAGW
jgi:hypothetical protein